MKGLQPYSNVILNEDVVTDRYPIFSEVDQHDPSPHFDYRQGIIEIKGTFEDPHGSAPSSLDLSDGLTLLRLRLQQLASCTFGRVCHSPLTFIALVNLDPTQ